MAIDFPNSPTLNQDYTVNTTTWTYDGAKWILKTYNSLHAVPVTAMMLWANTTYPTGWLLADGSAISRTTYADLFAAIGTTYGVGDGSSTFNIPSMPSAGSGSPNTIIKVTNSGALEPSAISHASNHAAGGSDVVSLKQSQINDFVFTTEAARDASITSPTEGMRAYLTAPTIPAATGLVSTLPSGIRTVYNGSVWVCVTPILAYTTTSGTTASITYTPTLSAGVNPSVTLVTGTTVRITVGANMNVSASGSEISISFAVSNATTMAASDDNRAEHDSPASGHWITCQATSLLTGLTAGTNTFTLNYAGATSAAHIKSFRNRIISVEGIA